MRGSDSLQEEVGQGRTWKRRGHGIEIDHETRPSRGSQPERADVVEYEVRGGKSSDGHGGRSYGAVRRV
jgi:hypothetical protein